MTDINQEMKKLADNWEDLSKQMQSIDNIKKAFQYQQEAERLRIEYGVQ